MAFTYVTVTHTFDDANGAAASGTVEFTPVAPMQNQITVVAAPVTATLDNNGSITQVLAANTDPGTTPTGTTYKVVERLAGQSLLIYYIQVRHDLGSPLDLRVLATGWIGSISLQVLVYASGAYPARPVGLPGGAVRYIGPVQPTDWLTNDEWINNT